MKAKGGAAHTCDTFGEVRAVFKAKLRILPHRTYTSFAMNELHLQTSTRKNSYNSHKFEKYNFSEKIPAKIVDVINRVIYIFSQRRNNGTKAGFL